MNTNKANAQNPTFFEDLHRALLDCDLRIAAAGDLQFALNEVPIGIPMPAVYCEIIKHAIGTSSANEMTLFGQVYDLTAAQRMGVVNRIVPPERLIEEAVAWARAVEPGCHPTYAFTKRALQAAALRAIDDARRLDLDLLASRMTDPGSLRAHARRYRELKGRDPTW
jgi:enoyl-CoA hydratase